MAITNHLTARDYFEHALVGRTVDRRAYITQSAGTSGGRTFQQLITSFGKRQSHRSGNHPIGLIAADYRSNPVQVKTQFGYRVKSAPGSNKEAAAENNPGPDAIIPAANAPDKTAEKSGLKQMPRTSKLLSPATPNQSGLNVTGTIEKNIQRAAGKYDLPANLLKGVIRAESNFQVRAVSRAGAQGLMQLMPGTARELGVNDPFDIEQNIDGGARYLRKMLDRFGGDVKLALAAYNAGPGTVERYGGKIPPYQETERYIDRVLRFSKQVV